MKKSTLFVTGAAALLLSSTASAAGGLVPNLQGTLTAVLSDVPGTVTNLVQALPQIVQNATTGVGNVVQSLPGVLGGTPIKTTTTTISVPLAGPGLLNATVANIPSQLGVQLASGGGSLDITITTGPQ